MSKELGTTWEQQDSGLDFGFIKLSAQATLNFVDADTYYPIPGTFTDGGLSNNFSLAANGLITYNGNGKVSVIGGTSDLSIDGLTAARVTYALFKNGALLPGAQTPHDFGLFNNTENVSITGAEPVANGDTYQVYAKCDDAGRTITIETLSVILA